MTIVIPFVFLFASPRSFFICFFIFVFVFDTNVFHFFPFYFAPIKQTVIATIVVILNSLGLYQTIANLYSNCIKRLTPKNVKLNQYQREDLCTTLIQGYQSQLKWITTLQQSKGAETAASTDDATTSTSINTLFLCRRKKEDELYSARSALRAWGEAQSIAMTLIKYSGDCTLYKSWCAFATIQHWKSCKILLRFLQVVVDDESEDRCSTSSIVEEKKKLEQKVIVLPRLAEMLMRRVCCSSDDGDSTNEGNEFPPSADDWRLFLECLDAQEKYDDAIEILANVRCGTEKQGRQIDDQNDVTHHLGSLIQLSERERVEIIADLNIKVGKLDVATNLYSERLLDMLPDQWSYWESVMTHSLNGNHQDYDSATEECNKILQQVMEKQELLRAEGKAPRVPLRGPNLFRVHMVAEGIRHCDTNDVAGLYKSIEKYGNLFCSQVSCCFQDLRPYIELLVDKSSSCVDNDGKFSEEILQMINWTKEIRKAHNPSIQSQQEEGVEETSDVKKERRLKLRAYIFSVKVCCELWYQVLLQLDEKSNVNLYKTVDKNFISSVPPVDELLQVWDDVLNLGSNPNDGGQKETLPGDDLIILATQLLIHQSHHQSLKEKEYTSFFAATILEKAINESPYNPYLKIAAIKIYAKGGIATRAWEIFKDLNVAHIQLESCSYFILRHLINNGLFKEAIDQAGKIIQLHSNSAKDISKFMPKSFENGNLQKGIEMISWQRYEMNHSLQILEAKGLIMNLAPLLTDDEAANSKSTTLSPAIGVYHGICGEKSTDVIQAEKIVRDSSNLYAAPSLIGLSNYDGDNHSWSDNRDFAVNEYEILERTKHPLSSVHSVSSAHMHAILTRIVLLIDVAKAPKKGKVAKYSSGDDLDIRVKSFLQTITNAEIFVNKSSHLSSVHTALWRFTLHLCQTVCVLSSGRASIEEDTKPANDSLATRETKCIEFLNLAKQQINEAMNAWKLMVSKIDDDDDLNPLEFVCKILAELLVPTYAIMRTASNLFTLFSWGKRKRNTKAAVGALADTALLFRNLVKEMSCTILEELSCSTDDEAYMNEMVELKDGTMKLLSSLQCFDEMEGSKILDQVLEHRTNHKSILRERMEPFFIEMINELDSFDILE